MLRIAVFTVIVFALSAPLAFAEGHDGGEGLYGPADDKVVTNTGFILIAGFPLLIKSQFPHINALQYAWLGPLIGAVIRPFGGWLADKLGGARVTFWVFVVMALGVVGVLYFVPTSGSGGRSSEP